MTNNFAEARKGLQQDLFALAELAEDAVETALLAIVDSDDALARSVIEEDREIKQMEMGLDKQCHNWLEIFHPEGEDLRLLCASIKIAHHLERIGDLAVDIAEHARILIPRQRNFSDLPPLAALSEKTGEALHDTVEMLLHQDPPRAQTIANQNRQIDQGLVAVIAHLSEKLSQLPEQAPPLAHCLLIARGLERIADLSSAIAGEIVFSATGKRLRRDPVSYSPLARDAARGTPCPTTRN